MNENNKKLQTHSEPNKTDPKRFKANDNYFTIAVYALVVIIVAAFAIKLIVSGAETIKSVRKIIGVLMPFILGALIAFILNPAVKRISGLLLKYAKIKHDKLRKALSICIAYLFVLALLGVFFFGVIPQLAASITDLVNYIPEGVTQISKFIDNLSEHFPNLDMDILRDAINNAIPDFINYAKDFATNLVPALYQLSRTILQWLLNIVIAVIVSIYMLTDKRPLVNSFRALVYAFVPVKHISATVEVVKEANRIFSSFVVGKAIDSTIIGLICFFFMTILQLPYALLISVIVGITNMIPYFGPFIGAAPGVVILLMISPLKALIFMIMILLLQQFDGLILGPKILGDSTGLKPLWIIVAITIGGSIGGVLGMFLGVPVVAFLRYLLNRFLVYRLKQRNITSIKNTSLE